MRLLWLASALAALVSIGCQPEIGDDCRSSFDCAVRGGRICDTTQPGGYCTVFNCEAGGCPSEADCVAFSVSASTLCADPQDTARLQRTFCMKHCRSSGDCRRGYSCVNLALEGDRYNAVVLDRGASGKICMIAHTQAAPSSDERSTQVCDGLPVLPPSAPSGEGGAAGGGSAGSSGNDGGSAAGSAGR